MSIELIVNPNQTLSWDDFCKTTPTYSIALDGFVNAGPMFDNKGPRVNFNHHEGVDRLATRSTCAQTLLAIRQGLFKCFRDSAGPKLTAFVNDCDEDVCTSWFLLKYHYLVAGTMNPLINRLVNIEDFMDSSAGCYPYPIDMPILQELAWIFEPYRKFRLSGQIDRRNADEYHSIIEDVEHRIMLHITGQGKSCPIDTEYSIVSAEKSWSLVREIGTHARTGMFANGISAYVSVREKAKDSWVYTIGRMSPFIPFDIPAIMSKLNEAEGTTGCSDCWGGGNMIGGSPRSAGSKIPQSDLIKIINEIINETL